MPLKNTFFVPLYLLIFFGLSCHQANALLVEQIVAVVNSEPILLSDLREKLPPGQKGDLASTTTTLDQIIDQKLQLQQANKKGITVSEDEIQKAIEETRLRNRLTNDEEFKKSLERENLTLKQISEEIKTQILIRKLVQREVLSGILVNEEEVKNYYQKHPEQVKIPEKRKVIQILFEFKPDDERDTKEKIRKEAYLASKELRQGKSIEQLTQENAELSALFTLSDLGAFQKGELFPALDQAAFSLEPETWSMPIETDTGIRLIKIEKNNSKLRPFEEVKKEIEDKIFREKSESAIEEWLANLRKSATIEIPLLKGNP